MEIRESLEEILKDSYQPDILLPEQYNGLRRGRRELDGERKLMLAVLEDAIQCYLSNIDAKTLQGRLLFHEARDWMRYRSSNGLFAYETLCEALGINADRLLSALERRRRGVLEARLPARQRLWTARPRKHERKRA